MLINRKCVLVLMAIIFPLLAISNADAGKKKPTSKVYKLKAGQEINIVIKSDKPKQVGFRDVESLDPDRELEFDNFAVELEMAERTKDHRGTYSVSSSTGAFFLSMTPKKGKFRLILRNLMDFPVQTTVYIDDEFKP